MHLDEADVEPNLPLQLPHLQLFLEHLLALKKEGRVKLSFRHAMISYPGLEYAPLVEEKDFLLELILDLLLLALNDFKGLHGQLHAVLEEPLGPQLPIVHLVVPVLRDEITRVLRVLALEGLQEI